MSKKSEYYEHTGTGEILTKEEWMEKFKLNEDEFYGYVQREDFYDSFPHKYGWYTLDEVMWVRRHAFNGKFNWEPVYYVEAHPEEFILE